MQRIRRAGGLFGCCMAPAIADRVEEPNDPAESSELKPSRESPGDPVLGTPGTSVLETKLWDTMGINNGNDAIAQN